MRLKLILIASLLAAVVGSGTAIGVILAVSASLKLVSSPGLLVLSTFALPAAAVSCASIFVYRHTARRRKLQATLTAIMALLLCLATFIAASLITVRLGRARTQTVPTPRTAN
jgi:purine-cytosine permease-like protein